MASPKPPRSPGHLSRPRPSFKRSESSPDMQRYAGPHDRLPPVPGSSPPLRKDFFVRQELPTLAEADSSASSQYQNIVGTPLKSASLPERRVHEDTRYHKERSGFHSDLATPRKHVFVNLPPPRSFSRTISPPPPTLFEVSGEGSSDPSVKQDRPSCIRDHGASSVDFRRGVRLQGKGRYGGSSLSEWVIPLMVFSLVCLGTMVTTLVYCLNIVETYKENSLGVFFHISDIHLDPLYRDSSSSPANCHTDGNVEERPLGQYGCDSPLLLLRSALSQMSRVAQKPDFVVVTGDMTSFNLTTNQTLHTLMQVDLEVQNAFPDPITKLLYAVGESELPREVRNRSMTNSLWLSRLAAAWKDVLEEAGPDAMETFKRGGYYTSVIEARRKRSNNPEPINMAVIVLNTLLYSMEVPDVNPKDLDPAGQLAWLESELKQARHWRRKVLIAGHKPPGVKGLGRGPLWRSHFEEQYRRIILQYTDVVVGQLFGYLHRDQFRLMHPDPVALTQAADVSATSSERSKLADDQSHRVVADGLDSESTEGSEGWNSREGMLELRDSSAVEKERATQTVRPLSRLLLGVLRPQPWDAKWFRSMGPKSWEGRGPHSRHSAEPRKEAAASRGDESPNRPQHRRGASRVGLEAAADRGGSAILIVPSLSPMYDNRPAFRLFRYDRWQRLLDYTEHTADLNEPHPDRMWGVEYGASNTYKIRALDTSSLKDLSFSFFNESGMPTEVFQAFCRLIAAGRQPGPNWGRDSIECCEECPHHMHCTLNYATYLQYQACQKRRFP